MKKVVASETGHKPDAGSDILSTHWGRRGVIALLLLGAGTLAVKSFPWVRFFHDRGREYQVIAEWQIPTDGKGMIIAIRPDSTPEELRTLGRSLQDKFHTVDDVVVMVFDDAEAARRVRKGSRVVAEKQFQEALVHQRAMYLKSVIRGKDSFTIYKPYPVIDEVIRFNESDLRKTTPQSR